MQSCRVVVNIKKRGESSCYTNLYVLLSLAKAKWRALKKSLSLLHEIMMICYFHSSPFWISMNFHSFYLSFFSKKILPYIDIKTLRNKSYTCEHERNKLISLVFSVFRQKFLVVGLWAPIQLNVSFQIDYYNFSRSYQHIAHTTVLLHYTQCM